MCSSRIYSYSLYRRVWKLLAGWGFSLRPENLSKCMKLDCNFQRGWGGGLRNNPFRGGLWKIFGTTQWIPDDSSVLAKFDNERFFKR